MKLDEAKERFVQAWGTLGSNWGISRSMAQVHALLLVSPDAMSTEEVMEQLQISRGNANMNLRDLLDWGLVRKVTRQGERKEYFQAEKDIYKVFKQIVRERRKRELEPIFRILEEVTQVDGPDTKEKQAFVGAVTDIHNMAAKADRGLETLMKADENWFLGTLMKLLR